MEERGVPIVGRGSPSCIPGTDPVRALLAKEAKQEKAKRLARVVEMSEVRLRQRRAQS